MAQMYWKSREGYVEAPKYVSQRQYLQDRKGQPDELYVGDFKE